VPEPLIKRVEKRITDISALDFQAKTLSFENLLVFFSRIYAMAVKGRSWLYKKKIAGSKRLPCYVISIGNIVAGGSGKTPMAIYIAKLVKELGLRPVVVSRGYGGRLEGVGGIVGNGEKVLVGPLDAGDEPFMMAGMLLFPVVIGKDRFRAGLMAIRAFDPDVIILDDGFQHLKLVRDLDIVLVDATRPLGNGRLLPAGRLREPPWAIKERADIVVFTRCANGRLELSDSFSDAFKEVIFEKPLFMTRHRQFLVCHRVIGSRVENRQANLEIIAGKRALLFSGISDNPGFRRGVESMGVYVKGHLEFMDHHLYKSDDISRIDKAARDKDVELLITTEKDYARLHRELTWNFDLAVIGIKIEFMADKDGFIEHIRKGVE